MKTKNGWHMPSGMCPKCLYDVEPIAELDTDAARRGKSALQAFTLYAICDCGYINEDVPWPFYKIDDIVLVTKALSELGFTVKEELTYESYLEDRFDEPDEREKDLDDRAFNGWEDAFHGQFYE